MQKIKIFFLNAAKWSTIILFLILILISSSCQRALPITEFDKSFVFAVTFNAITSIQSVIIPPAVEEMYLLSDVYHVIAPRQTRVYYWPLTNRFLADWNTENELIDGFLEVYQGTKLLSVLNLEDYVVQYDQLNIPGTLRIYFGDEAVQKYSEFKKAQSQYQQDYFDYYSAKADWISEMDDVFTRIQSGETDLEFPEEPMEPARFTIYSTPISKGFPIALTEGTYNIKFRLPDGSYKTASQKKLIIFKERQSSVTYNIIPESRWTKPIVSNQSGGTIYVAPGSNIYISPFYGSEYRELFYSRMLDPQDTSPRGTKWMWTQNFPLPNVTMDISGPQDNPIELSLDSFYVRQTGGSALSYTVLPYDPNTMNRVSFNGFNLGTTNWQSHIKVYLKDPNGNALPGSERQIFTINPNSAHWLYIISFFPFLLGLVVIISRKKRTIQIQPYEGN
jgi:hypothetical protein